LDSNQLNTGTEVKGLTDLDSPLSTHGAEKSQAIGDLCPECGVAAVINEEGCRKCYSCGYSEC
jgi:hypothetical protein